MLNGCVMGRFDVSGNKRELRYPQCSILEPYRFVLELHSSPNFTSQKRQHMRCDEMRPISERRFILAAHWSVASADHGASKIVSCPLNSCPLPSTPFILFSSPALDS